MGFDQKSNFYEGFQVNFFFDFVLKSLREEDAEVRPSGRLVMGNERYCFLGKGLGKRQASIGRRG
jgi:hypothetical protein